MLASLEICAGAGGQAVGLEQAGFDHVALVEIDHAACETLRLNRPAWNVLEEDVTSFSARPYRGQVDLFAGGVPCPPFSKAGRQLGSDDERDLFPTALRLVDECRPRAVLLENVPGLMEDRFKVYRQAVTDRLRELGYVAAWRVLHAATFGVPQLRPRVLCVALPPHLAPLFSWPEPGDVDEVTVGQALIDAMAAAGWGGAEDWAAGADKIAPTLVGGSKKHGGPDLGPTRAKRQWAALGVNGHTIAAGPPGPDHEGMPRLTVQMAALIQGFPPEWQFYGKKTAAYRQVGNAFPPPVARAVAAQVRDVLLLDSPMQAGQAPRKGREAAQEVTAGAAR